MSRFRSDINNLRAVAVLAVVGFHFFPDFVSSGFAGVDVFFVVSGYLMTAIVASRISAGCFKFSDFFWSRYRRIVPPLICLVVVLWVCFFFVLPPSDFKIFGKHGLSSLLFFSNYVYGGEAGYFDSSAYEKWLLHTWSLSIEWQFYVLYPFFLALLFRCVSSARIVGALLVCVSVSLFSFTVLLNDTGDVYYLSSGRFWVMCLGGVSYFFPFLILRRKSQVVLWWCMVAVSFFVFDSATQWPGFHTLVPVIGTMLIINSNLVSTGVGVNNRFVSAIGKSSYSIYLWHWPLCVYLFYFGYGQSSYWFVLGGVIGSFVLGYMSYLLVERHLCSSFIFDKDKWFWHGLFFSAIVLLMIVTFYTRGFFGHYPESVRKADLGRFDYHADRLKCLPPFGGATVPCSYLQEDSGFRRIVVVGDSHAQSLVTEFADRYAGDVLGLAMASCRPISGYVDDRGRSCDEHLNEVKALLEPTDVVVVHSWLSRIYEDQKYGGWASQVAMEAAYIQTICSLAEKSSLLIIVEDTPYFQFSVPVKLSLAFMTGDTGYMPAISLLEYRDQVDLTSKLNSRVVETCDAEYYTPETVFCDDRKCSGGEVSAYYFDSNHLTNSGAALLVNSILSKFKFNER